MFDKNIFSNRLKGLRKERGLKQEEVGNLINVTKTQISDIEKGRRTTTVENIVILANYFDVPTDYLVGNGLFVNWEEIMHHKDLIIEWLEHTSDFMKKLDMHNQDENFLMGFFPAIFSKIDFEGGNIIINTLISIDDLKQFKLHIEKD